MAQTVTMYRRISNTTISTSVPEHLMDSFIEQGWFFSDDKANERAVSVASPKPVYELTHPRECSCGRWPGAICACPEHAEVPYRTQPPAQERADKRATDSLGNTVEVNEVGAMQAIVEGRFDLLDYDATRILAEVYGYGAKKYAEENWRGIPVRSHLNHAVRHILMALHEMRTGVNPEPGEDHLGHALCRVHMATAIREQGGPSKEAMQ